MRHRKLYTRCTASFGPWREEKKRYITYLSVRVVFHGFGLNLLKELPSFVPDHIMVFS